ncbi:cellulase family glycosylhydrolase, partial [Victivallis vadensis]
MKFASLSGVLCLMMLVAFPLKAEIGLPFPGNWQLPPGAAVSAGVLTVASTDREARLARTEIDSRDYIGRTLIVHFDVKYTDVSTPALSHNGIKLMIHTRVNGKQFWRNCPPLSGSSDGWKRITVRENISWDTEWISIEVGLQDSTGILEVRNVEIQDYDPMVLFREPPVPLPENFKCAYDERLRNLPPMRGVMSPVRYRVNDIPDLAKWNANLIRWQLRPSPQKIYIPGVDQQKAERNRTTENFLDALDRELQTLDKVISQCREAGIMVMIDMHRVPGGSENLGEIQSEARMFNSEELAAEFIEA